MQSSNFDKITKFGIYENSITSYAKSGNNLGRIKKSGFIILTWIFYLPSLSPLMNLQRVMNFKSIQIKPNIFCFCPHWSGYQWLLVHLYLGGFTFPHAPLLSPVREIYGVVPMYVWTSSKRVVHGPAWETAKQIGNQKTSDGGQINAQR